MFLMIFYVCNEFGYLIWQVGFEMIDTIADAEGISMGSVSFKAQFGKGTFFLLDSRVIILSCYIVILSNIIALPSLFFGFNNL